MWAYAAFLACAVLIFAVPMLIVHSIKEYKRWRLESAVHRATACKPWIGKDNRPPRRSFWEDVEGSDYYFMPYGPKDK